MVKKDYKNQAYQTLREKLINCVYPPGTMLNEAMLAEELQISRTPVREALTRIEHEGFIRIIPQKGILVTEISFNDVKQIFQARLEIESVALRLAGPMLPEKELLSFREKFSGEEPDVRVGFRLDTAMHLFIAEHCGNRFIIETLHKIFDDNTRVIISSKQNEVKIHDARMEHLEILDLLLNGNFNQAEHSTRFHIESCKKAAFDFFYNFQPYSAESPQMYQNQLQRLKSDRE